MADIQNEPTGKVESQGKLTNQIGSVDERKKQFKCEICDYSSSQKGDLNRHVASVHEKKKPNKCETCDFSCFAKSHMKSHVVSVHENKRPFKCEICDYSSSLKGTLKNMSHQFMRKRSHLRVKYATTFVQKTDT